MLTTTARWTVLVCGLALTPAAVAAAAAGEDRLPIEAITLYRSGVGSFERQGLVEGDATISLTFAADQINDILKSMVVLDLDGGTVGAVSYDAQKPLAEMFGGGRIPTGDSLVEILEGATGERATFETASGTVTGRIIGTESLSVPVRAGDSVERMPERFVNVLTGSGIRAVGLSEVRSFAFESEELMGEYERMLATVSERRGEQSRSVSVRFAGPRGSARRAVVSYVHEMPVWKTSYRLVLPDPEAGGEPTIQGWAIVENTTDSDWEGVSLSLASGRPVSFTMDLYQPLFAPRPEVPVPFLAAVAPKLHESALNAQRFYHRAASADSYDAGTAAEQAPAGTKVYSLNPELMSDYLAEAQATAGVVGEQFMYTLDQPVTLERQRSAMLPILSSSIEGRRVSIFNAQGAPRNPMRGVELTNDTGLTLMPGPIAVYDASAYAGDAQIPHTSRGMNRLLSYAVDLDVAVATTSDMAEGIVSISIVDGVVRHRVQRERTTAYTLTNNDGTAGRTVLVEQPKLGAWDLVSPDEPYEETESLYRFEVELPAGGARELRVVERSTIQQTYGLTGYDMELLSMYRREGKMSAEVADAIRTAASMQQEIRRLQRTVEELTRERDEIATDQQRLRENMRTIDRTTDLYARYLRKLSEQEDQVESLDERLASARERYAQKNDELRRYLSDLDVD